MASASGTSSCSIIVNHCATVAAIGSILACALAGAGLSITAVVSAAMIAGNLIVTLVLLQA